MGVHCPEFPLLRSDLKTLKPKTSSFRSWSVGAVCRGYRYWRVAPIPPFVRAPGVTVGAGRGRTEGVPESSDAGESTLHVYGGTPRRHLAHPARRSEAPLGEVAAPPVTGRSEEWGSRTMDVFYLTTQGSWSDPVGPTVPEGESLLEVRRPS